MNLHSNLVQFQADLEAETEYLFLKTHEGAKELSNNSMGKLLLGKIGMLYIEQSKQELGSLAPLGILDSWDAHMGEVKDGLKQKANIAGALWSVGKVTKKMHEEKQADQKKIQEEESLKDETALKEEEEKR